MKTNVSNKQISINMIANIVSYSANLFVAFILTPFLISKLGKETYSFYPIANTIVNYMSVLMNAMNSISSRFVTLSIVKEDSDEANKYFSSTFVANLVMSFSMAIPMIIIIIFLDKFMEVPINSLAAVRMLFILLFTSALINISAAVFGIATFAKNRIDLRSLRELVVAISKLALYLLLYKLLPPSIAYIGVVIVIAAIINFLFQLYYTKRLLPEMNISKKNISWLHTKELLSSSCWTAINSFGNNLLVGMSLVMANMFYGAAASGEYSIVNTVPQFLSGVISMLVGVFYPVIIYEYGANNRKRLMQALKKAQNYVGLFGCSVAAVFASLSNEFFKLWTPAENSIRLSRLTYIIIIPYFFIACLWSLTNMNVVMNKVKIPALFTLGIGVMNIFISYLTYKFWDFGMISLPLISTILQIFWIGIFIPIYVTYCMKVKWFTFYIPVIKSLLCGGIVILLINIAKQYFVLDSWYSFLLFGTIAGGFAIVLFGISLLSKEGLHTILKR